jgi:heme-degrading monooxygenase HmoA
MKGAGTRLFLLNEILVFAPARRKEALDRLAYIHGLMASKPGFRQAIVGRYLGDGVRHTVLRIWEDEDAYRRFREGPDGDYGKGRPPGLYTNEQVTPQWNSVLETGAGAGGDRRDYSHLVKVQFEIPEDGWERFLDQEKRLESNVQSLGGVDHRLVCRAKDRPECLVIIKYPDKANWDRLIDSPEYAKLFDEMLAYRKAHPHRGL